MKQSIVAACAAACLVSASAHATVPADGYLYSRSVLSSLVEGCVAEGFGGTYVGVGSFPATAGSRSIWFVTEAGEELVIATGMNAISDCWFDRENNLLYVTDNGGDYDGATTGDTVFVFAGDTVADTADEGNELLPPGSIPFAAAITPFGDDLLVSDAAGNGNGEVILIDLSGPTATMSTFAGGFDYAGAVVDVGGNVLIGDSHSDFSNSLHEYESDGDFVRTISTHTYAHGAIDGVQLADGAVALTGADTIVRVSGDGTSSPLVTGLDGNDSGFPAFGGGVTLHPAGYRLSFLASSFSGADDDKSIHRLIPIDSLVPGRGRTDSECLHEFYGVELLPTAPGKPARSAVCVDGEACDDDGAADGACTFPVGLCINVPDARFDDCEVSGLRNFEMLATRPIDADVRIAAVELQNTSPRSDSTCLSGGMRVPLRSDGTKAGKGLIKVRATSTDDPPRRDTDTLKLVCLPAAE